MAVDPVENKAPSFIDTRFSSRAHLKHPFYQFFESIASFRQVPSSSPSIPKATKRAEDHVKCIFSSITPYS